MIDPLEGQDKPKPEVLFSSQEEQVRQEQEFVEFIKSRLQGLGPSSAIESIHPGKLFVAGGISDEFCGRNYFMRNPRYLVGPAFLKDGGVMLSREMPGSQHKYKPSIVAARGECGRYVESVPRTLAEDFLNLNFQGRLVSRTPRVVVPRDILCQLGFAHKGKLSLFYSSSGQLYKVGWLTHQVFEKGQPEKVADLIRLLRDQVNELRMEGNLSFARAGYRYEFATKGDSVQTKIFGGDGLKEEIEFPLQFNQIQDQLCQRLDEIGILEDPFGTPPSQVEKNFFASLPGRIVKWVSHTKLSGHSH